MPMHQWVLRPEYLEASHAEGRFLEEAPFEWGASSGSSSGGSCNDDDGGGGGKVNDPQTHT